MPSKTGVFIHYAVIFWYCIVFPIFSLYSVDLDSLGPLLGQIIVALSPLVEGYADNVAEIFEFLIVEHRCVHVYCT